MKKQYQKSDYHNYIIFPITTEHTLQQKMLWNNRIESILPCNVQKIEDTMFLRYEVDGRSTLEEYITSYSLTKKECFEFYHAIIQTIKNIKQFFLVPTHLLLDIDAIYIHNRTKKLEFCYVPEYEEGIIPKLITLTEYFLKSIDHKKKEDVLFLYGFYQLLGETNTTIAMIEQYLVESERESKGQERNQIEQLSEEERGEKKEEKKEERLDIRLETIADIPIKKIERDSIEFEEKKKIKKEKKKKDNGTKKRNNKNTKQVMMYYTYQFLIGGILLVCMGSTSYFFFNRQWKNGMIGIAIVLFLFYILLDRKKAFHKTKEEGERIPKEQSKRAVVREKNELDGEETILLYHHEEVERQQETIPYLKAMDCDGENIPLSYMPMTIGSLAEAVDVVVQGEGVSRIHISIEQEEREYYVRDLNSKNGTKWNGQSLIPQMPQLLKRGDRIMIGKEEYEFQME